MQASYRLDAIRLLRPYVGLILLNLKHELRIHEQRAHRHLNPVFDSRPSARSVLVKLQWNLKIDFLDRSPVSTPHEGRENRRLAQPSSPGRLSWIANKQASCGWAFNPEPVASYGPMIDTE